MDVSRINMSTTVLGYRISAPIMIAPSAMHKLAHPEGRNYQKDMIMIMVMVMYSVYLLFSSFKVLLVAVIYPYRRGCHS